VSGVWIHGGVHTLRIVAETADYNLNYFDVAYSDGTAAKRQKPRADLGPGITGISRAPLQGSRDIMISTRGPGVLVIHDLRGTVVDRRTLRPVQDTYLWRPGSPGVYLAELRSGAVRETQRIIVK
jgi:hypothetical protein